LGTVNHYPHSSGGSRLHHEELYHDKSVPRDDIVPVINELVQKPADSSSRNYKGPVYKPVPIANHARHGSATVFHSKFVLEQPYFGYWRTLEQNTLFGTKRRRRMGPIAIQPDNIIRQRRNRARRSPPQHHKA
jgi:hypothetical protein